MTDKERMEEIKEIYRWAIENSIANRIADSDIEWLINRVEELELEVNDWRDEAIKWNIRFRESEESHLETKELLRSTISEIKRYKQALEFYADEEHYKEKLISEAQYDADGICISNDEYAPPIIYLDKGETARKALESEK
ncbi:hypothetical protein [Caldifermentibacillus hisashii]|uniref:hypothetical protein n=1 Tax=Caldifermentibacillus hisashii TaxID=996558 RepID=UPI0030EA85B0